MPSDLFYDGIRLIKPSFSYSESKFGWELPLGLKISKFWVSSSLLKHQITNQKFHQICFKENLLDKTEQNC
jgi:hypothetical protein